MERDFLNARFLPKHAGMTVKKTKRNSCQMQVGMIIKKTKRDSGQKLTGMTERGKGQPPKAIVV